MKKYRFQFLAIIAPLFCINLFIFFNRDEGYKYFPYKSYSQLYVSDSTLYLKDLHFNNNTLALSFSLHLQSPNYHLIIDDSVRSSLVIPANNVLQVPLLDSIHRYKLVPGTEKDLPITVQIDHSKKAAGDYINEFIYCNLPGPQIKVSTYDIWTKGIKSFTADEIGKGNNFLRKNTNAFSAQTDSARLMEVCRLLSMMRPNAKGIEASEVAFQSPYLQLLWASENKINADCGTYSVMLHYLCSLLGLPNRVITFSGPVGNWQFGIHNYNEIYLREKQQWVLCDGLSNAYLLHDSIRFYNAADVYKMAHTNSFSNKYVYTFDQGNVKRVSYDSLAFWHQYYNRNNANLCYLHPGAGLPQEGKRSYLKSFFSFDRNYDLYSDVNQNDWLKISIRMIAFYSLLVMLAWYALWEMKTKKQ